MAEKKYMRRAIELAKLGEGFVSPNPMVGAVIVKDNQIIAEGYHAKYGDLHAERAAIANSTSSLKDSTLYVTLEPCCHFGKQPPCTDAIIESGISKVIIGSDDPNPFVNGKGIRILEEHGIEVETHFLKEECDQLNSVFFHFIKNKTPYGILKYAMTLDGKICTSSGDSKWITGDKARKYVHHLRGKYTAIMAGIGTIIADNPMLNCRMAGAKNPIRIICDTNLRISENSNIVKSAKEIKTIIACKPFSTIDATTYSDTYDTYLLQSMQKKSEALRKNFCEILEIPIDFKSGHIDVGILWKKLGQMGIDSILIEGGGTLAYSLIEQDLINKVFAFIGPTIIGGAKAKTPVEGKGICLISDACSFQLENITKIDKDLCIEAIRKK
ncbi:bifunctional diaminohydroxyphosphoribosylaminopyrimidine deaminase/5-amino-6-(5-phosphoribosylamino)uracil reductase RibD [Butyrivibrio sp. NC3005]|uniref:bifunctional diaminohydroxyphosphoribosylaminopyrimidine deaminase/5-amino-6-(5-phosphoribosylamino)uracil reductase RibD n=1 Tax=Butyrivibrio sp. NC3005 TaxID=1280685 RepID=UPI00041D7FA4|nr:bifunctional diaminohydroxyphosphoribosylaminopyrimidine deaminase/5-amino-6-(5-phosphoribosylamino)uracil reductase RibD [Butyrivibrio sp. NC3005]